MHDIQVFLRSTLISSQLISLHYSYDYHYYMEAHFRGSYHWLRDQGFSKGRIFEPDSAALLPVLDKVMAAFGPTVRIYDLSTIKGRTRSFRSGVRKTPSVVIGGEKHLGLEDARLALSALLEVEAAES
jgi:hypothetical protein